MDRANNNGFIEDLSGFGPFRELNGGIGLDLVRDQCNNETGATSFSQEDNSSFDTSRGGIPFNTREMTLSLWFAKTTENITNEQEGIIAKGFEPNNLLFALYLSQATNPFDINLTLANQTENPETFTITKTLEKNRFYHFLASISSEGIQLYIDGILNASFPFGGLNPNDPFNLTMGRYFSPIKVFNGIIDEVRIYNQPLSEAEIETLFQLGCTPWKENETIGLCRGDIYDRNG